MIFFSLIFSVLFINKVNLVFAFYNNNKPKSPNCINY